jgi:hypothetical protein
VWKYFIEWTNNFFNRTFILEIDFIHGIMSWRSPIWKAFVRPTYCIVTLNFVKSNKNIASSQYFTLSQAPVKKTRRSYNLFIVFKTRHRFGLKQFLITPKGIGSWDEFSLKAAKINHYLLYMRKCFYFIYRMPFLIAFFKTLSNF